MALLAEGEISENKTPGQELLAGHAAAAQVGPDGNRHVRHSDDRVPWRLPVRRYRRGPVGLREAIPQGGGPAGFAPPGPSDFAANGSPVQRARSGSGPGHARPLAGTERAAPHRPCSRARRDNGGQHDQGVGQPGGRPGRSSDAGDENRESYRAGPRSRGRPLRRRAGRDRTAGWQASGSAPDNGLRHCRVAPGPRWEPPPAGAENLLPAGPESAAWLTFGPA